MHLTQIVWERVLRWHGKAYYPKSLVRLFFFIFKWQVYVKMQNFLICLKESERVEMSNCRVLEKAMAPHSSTLAWKIPWTEEPGGLQSVGSLSQTRPSDFTFTFHFHALEKEMATHSSVLAWRILGTGEPGGLQSMGSHRVGHDWSDLAAAAAAGFRTSLSLFTFMHWRRKWQPSPVFLPGESQGLGSLVGYRLRGHTESDMTEVT